MDRVARPPEDHADQLAHHYLSALELARAAGIDAGLLEGSAASALERAGHRAFGLNAFVSAARFYGEALALGVDERDRPRLLFRLGSALHLAGDERRIEILEQARDALVAAADPEGAAEASALLAGAWRHRGQGERAHEQLKRAQELVRGRGVTPAAARVLAEVARFAMLAGESEEAVRVGREALELAERLDLRHLVPHALQTIGIARTVSGDLGGIGDVERAIQIALADNNPDAVRAYNNLAAALWNHAAELRRAHEVNLEGLEVAERARCRERCAVHPRQSRVARDP